MKNQFCLVSRCVLVKKSESHFHFNGYFLGQKISRVIVRSQGGRICLSLGEFVTKEDYVLFLEILEIKNTILITNHLKSKHLSQINF